MAETITVQIHGSEYKLRGDDADRIRRAAELINEQMRDVAGKAPTQPAATVAVLAALNTAEALMEARERSRSEARELVERIDALNASIDSVLHRETAE